MNRIFAAVVRAFGPGRQGALENAEPYEAFEQGRAGTTEFAFCQSQQRTTAHAVDVHGTRCCLDCHPHPTG